MSMRTTLFLFLATLIIGGFIWFEERHMPSTDDFKRTRKRVFDIRADRIESIAVSLCGETMEGQSWQATRGAGGWILEKPVLDHGDSAVFSSMSSKIEFTDYERKFESGGDLSPFGFDKPTPRVILVNNGNRIEFDLGDSDALKKGNYLRRRDTGDIFLVPSSFGSIFTRPLSFVRDKSVFQASFQLANEVMVESPSMNMKFLKTDGAWLMTEPSKSYIEEGVLKRFVDGLNGIRISSFEDKPLQPGHDFVKCSVYSNDGGKIAPPSSPGLKNSISIWKTGEGKWLALRTGSPNCFAVTVPPNFDVPIGVEAFRLRTLLPAGMRGATRFAVVSGGTAVEILEQDGEWSLQTPVSGPANHDLIYSILEVLTSTAIDYVLLDPERKSAGSLNSVMTVMVTKGATTFEVDFLSERGVSSRLLARRRGEDDLMEVPFSFLSDIPVSCEEYRVPILAEVDSNSVISIRVVQKDGESEVIRDGSGWKSLRADTVADTETIDSILLAFSRFIAGLPGPLPDEKPLAEGKPDIVMTLGVKPGTQSGPDPELHFWNTGTKRLAYRPGDRRSYVIGDMVYEMISSPLTKASK